MGRMKDELKGKHVPPRFYKSKSPSSVQPHKSNTLLSSPVKFTPSSQTIQAMMSQPTLDDIMAKIDNLL